jgi:hypothetical protein
VVAVYFNGDWREEGFEMDWRDVEEGELNNIVREIVGGEFGEGEEIRANDN